MTLTDFFSFPEGAIPAGAGSALESSPAMEAVRESLSSKASRVRWTAVGDEIRQQTSDLFDLRLADILVGAWNRYRIFAEYRDREEYPPDEVCLVPLAEHTVRSEHNPSIEIKLGEATVERLVFDVSLALTLEGFAVKLQDGRIKAIRTGSLEGEGMVSLKGAKLLERPMSPIQLPGTIDLGEGIPIGAPPETAVRPAAVPGEPERDELLEVPLV